MSIRITSKGLEVDNPTFDELSKFKALENAIKLAERDRIIKLLESIDDYPKNWDHDDPIASVVALIKGETE